LQSLCFVERIAKQFSCVFVGVSVVSDQGHQRSKFGCQ